MRTIAGLMVAGSLGTLSRYLVDGFVSQRTPAGVPWGTFVVNVTACLLLGVVFTVITQRAALNPSTRVILVTGFIGSYSTFSTLMLESVRLAEAGAISLALLNTLGSVLAGILAVAVGTAIGRAL
ncbi:MAG: fluoride efflux transporter CrcB [Candidatus Dormibacteria bacterium]